MTEEYLHYVWKYQLFPNPCLTTFEQESITVKKNGFHNHNSGPDFLNARIIIGKTSWAGNVEIHVRASDWNRHKHQHDKAYNNVVLHVVYENDIPIFNQAGNAIPTIELKKHIDHHHYFQYERFIANESWVPCANQIDRVPDIVLSGWKERMVFERLENKAQVIWSELEKTNGDWEEVFHRVLFRSFGMKVNSEAMMELAKKTSVKLLIKESGEIKQLEALLFGQAGMLSEVKDDEYYQNLRREYLYIKQKYHLKSLKEVQWRYSRLRPPNFPTIRIAQLAMMYSTNAKIFDLIRDRQSYENIQLVIQTGASEYWQKHYRFGKEVKANTNYNVGQLLVDNVMINVVIPVAFAYGKSISDQKYVDYALKMLEEVKAEDNKIVRGWKGINVSANGAQESQALLELYQNYCSAKKCLNCNIGVFLLKES